MAEERNKESTATAALAGPRISLDWWAVITALALGLLVLLNIIPGVPW